MQCTREELGENIESVSLDGHLGRDSTITKLKPKYFWPKMWADLNNYMYIKNCE